MKPSPSLPAAVRKTSRTPLAGLKSAGVSFFLSPRPQVRDNKTWDYERTKEPKMDPESDQKANASWETETNFTLLSYRTCILLLLLLLFSLFLFLLFYDFLFLFFLFSFLHFICLIALLDCFSLFSLSQCILIFLLSLHLYSNNTLLLVFYFLFFLFTSYISCHIIVIPVLL